MNKHIQVDCWAVDYGTAKDLANSVRAALDKHCVPLRELDGVDQSSELRRITLDFSVWYTET